MMEKKLLIAVDGSVNAMGAAHYAAQMAAEISELNFELIYVQPVLSQYLTQEARTKGKARAALEKVIERNKTKAEDILTQTIDRMIQKGVNKNRIGRVTIPNDSGIASDLLVMAQAKKVDAIIVGRRGASYLRQWVMGSVTSNLVAHTKTIPVWIVDGQADNTSVLLAADGSTSCLRALDHMAFMLAANPNRKIHMVHVQPRFQDYCEIEVEKDDAQLVEAVLLDSDRQCMDNFYAHAQKVLEKNDIDPSRLKLESLTGGLSISKAIVKHIRENKIGAVVLGKSSKNDNLLTGSVSRSIIHKIENAALWVVP